MMQRSAVWAMVVVVVGAVCALGGRAVRADGERGADADASTALLRAAAGMEEIADAWDVADAKPRDTAAPGDPRFRGTANVVRTTRWVRLGGRLDEPDYEAREPFRLRVEGPRFHYRAAAGRVARGVRPPDPDARVWTGRDDGSYEREVLGTGDEVFVHRARPRSSADAEAAATRAAVAASEQDHAHDEDAAFEGAARGAIEESIVYDYLVPTEAWTPDALAHPWHEARRWGGGATWTETVERQLANGSAAWRDGGSAVAVDLGGQTIVYHLGTVDDGNSTVHVPIRGMTVIDAATGGVLYELRIDATRDAGGSLLPRAILRRGVGADAMFAVEIAFSDWVSASDDPPLSGAFDFWALEIAAGTRRLDLRGDGQPVRVYEVVPRDPVAATSGAATSDTASSPLDLREKKRRGAR